MISCQGILLDINKSLRYDNAAMEKILEQALLYDFYGDLLTEHQRDIYEGYVQENLSLSELAEISGVSRQGIHDLIRRVEKTLQDYEAKLHLVEKFLHIRDEVTRIQNSSDLEEARKIAEEILEIL